jgi:8-oxo-dGTP pyrophosphatase MutT (NUDIX family)
MGISQATLDTIGLLNKRLENLLNVEVVRVLERFDAELLGIKRPNTNCKASASCMVMGEDGEARVLQYGEAIPQLLYSDQEAQMAFSSSMSVVLNTDDKGNLFLSPPGSRGVELPLSSDVMWTRQMAAYAASVTGTDGEKIGNEPAVPATVAAVTIPVNANGDVLLTQRAFRGMYDGMWVFPGGHVDKGESLMTAAAREINEETGLTIDDSSLKPLAVWEGAVSSKKKQFCVVFFAADAMCENALSCSMELQTKEVHRAAWVSKDLLPRILDTHVLHSELEIDGVLIEDDQQHDTRIKMSELQNGLGEGHKFALRAYLEGLESEASGRSAGQQKEAVESREQLEMAPLRVETAERGLGSLEARIAHALRDLGAGLRGARQSA